MDETHFCGKVYYLELFTRLFLPFLYTTAFGYLLVKSRYFKKEAIPTQARLIFLGGKIGIGLLYTYIMIHLVPRGDDIDLLFGGGLEMYHAFWNDPLSFPAYLKQTFEINDFRLGHTDSDFVRTVFDGIKFLHFLLNFLSGGELYTNVVLFNGIASFAFLRLWVYLKNETGYWWLGAWIFLFPSAFFFTSVLLKEGIEWTLIAFILPILIRGQIGSNPARILLLALLFFLLFFFKYLIAATFITSLVLFKILKRFPGKEFLLSILSVLLFLFAFFYAGKITPALDMPQYIIERRIEFQELEANTRLEMRTLEPNALSFLQALPEAAYNVLIRPVPGEGGKLVYLAFSFEIILFWLFICLLLVRGIKYGFRNPTPEAWAFLLFSLINLVIIGFTITNTGAIIRYRSVFLPGIGYFFWMLCLAPDFIRFKHFIKRSFKML